MKKILCIIILTLFLTGCGAIEKEVKLPNLDSHLNKISLGSLEITQYIKKDDEIDVMLVFNKEVLRNGPVKVICDAVSEEFEGQYSKIKLNITQEKPTHDFVEFEYTGTWERKK